MCLRNIWMIPKLYALAISIVHCKHKDVKVTKEVAETVTAMKTTRF